MSESLGYRSLQDILRSKLRDAILGGQYEPGSRLNINTLAKQFNVSAVPVREALRALEAEGLAIFSPNRGAVVKALSIDELRETFMIRIPLECLAIREAAQKIQIPDLDRLRGLIESMERTTDGTQWLQLNQDFHLLSYRAAGMPRLYQMIETLWAVGRPYLSVFMSRVSDLSKAHREHQAILSALVARNSEEAAKLIEMHLLDTQEIVLGAIREAEKNLDNKYLPKIQTK